MNFLGLVQRLTQEAGASGAGPTDVVGQQGEYARMVNWVNDAWLDIQSLHQDWEFLRTTCSFPTVDGQAVYTATQANATNFGMWDIDTFRNYANPSVTLSIASPCVANIQGHGLSVGDTVTFFTTGALPTGMTAGTVYYVASVVDADNFTFATTATGTAINTSGSQSGTQTMTSGNTLDFSGLRSEIFMEEDHYANWRDLYMYGNLRFTRTRPMDIAVSPAKSLCLGPIPQDGYTIVGDYFQAPTYMVAKTDTPSLPIQYQMAIVWKALTFYGGYEEDAATVMRGENMFNEFKNRMELNFLPNVDFTGALA